MAEVLISTVLAQMPPYAKGDKLLNASRREGSITEGGDLVPQ
jgi:hypothetical protein